MCFGGDQPDNPVTKPAYAVEDMNTAVTQSNADATKTTADAGTVDTVTPETTQSNRKSGLAISTM